MNYKLFFLKIIDIVSFKFLKNNLLFILLLHSLVFVIGLFFNYWHYKFSYSVFLSKNIKGIYVYFIIYALIALIEIFINALIFKKESYFIIQSRQKYYNYITTVLNIKNMSANNSNCQRISEDIKELFEFILKISIPLFFSILKLFSYSVIVFKITNFYILLLALMYSLISNIVINKLDNHLIELESEIEDAEAHLRKNLIFLFEKQKQDIPNMNKIMDIEKKIIDSKKRLKFRNNIILKIGSFLKYLLPMPLYLNGYIEFPILGQVVNSLTNLFESSNFLISKKEEIIKLKSVTNRLSNLN